MHVNGCFWGRLYSGNIHERLPFKGSCKDIFILEILTQILHFLLWRQVKEERIFMDFISSKGFDEKCRYTELTLNFVQKQIF